MEAKEEVSPTKNSDLDIEQCLNSILDKLDIISEQGHSADSPSSTATPVQEITASSSLLAETASKLVSSDTSLDEKIEKHASNLKEKDASSKVTDDSRTRKGSFGSIHASFDALMTESSPKMSPISSSSGASVLFTDLAGVTSHLEGIGSPYDPVDLNKTFKEYPSRENSDFSENSRDSLPNIVDYIKNPPSPISRPRLSNEEALQCREMPVLPRRDDYYYETPKFPKPDVEKAVASLFYYGQDTASVKWNEELPDIDSPTGEIVLKPGSEEETAPGASSFGTRKVQKDSNDTGEVALVVGHLKSRTDPLVPSKPTFKKPWPATGAIPKVKSNTKISAVKPTSRPPAKSTIVKPVTGKTGPAPTTSGPAKVKYDLTKNIYAQKTAPKSKGETDPTKPKPPSTSSTRNPAGSAGIGMVKTATIKPVEIAKRGISATRRKAADIEIAKRAASATRKTSKEIETDKRATSASRNPPKGPIPVKVTAPNDVASRSSRNPRKNT